MATPRIPGAKRGRPSKARLAEASQWLSVPQVAMIIGTDPARLTRALTVAASSFFQGARFDEVQGWKIPIDSLKDWLGGQLPLLKQADVARIMGLTPPAITAMVKRRQIEVLRLPSGHLRISPQALASCLHVTPAASFFSGRKSQA